MTYSPIALFVYNRLEHTRSTVEALKNNLHALQSELYIFSDGPKNDIHNESVESVRKYIKSIDGFKSVSIVERSKNFGLANSIIDGVTSLVIKIGHVIVLEDDMVTSPYFLKYMNDALKLYQENKNVASIHGYVYPVNNLPETFFLRGADCWGWATWKDRWVYFEQDGKKLLNRLENEGLLNRFDFNGAYPFSKMLHDQIVGKNDSWAIRWHASAFINNKLTLYPGKSLVLNIGNDGSGTHCKDTNLYSSEISQVPVDLKPIPVVENQEAFFAIEQYFRKQKVGIFERLFLKGIQLSKKFSI